MAWNRVLQGNPVDNRAKVVPEGTKSGDFLLIEDRGAVAVTNRGDVPAQSLVIDGVSYTVARGGASLKDDEASVEFNGVFELPVTGVTTGTASGTKVYYKAATTGETPTPAELVLTASGNTLFGHVDWEARQGHVKVAGVALVRVGA